VKLRGLSIWHYRVVEVFCEEPHKQWRRKGNAHTRIESNVKESAMLLKQQPEQKDTNWNKKIEQGVLPV